jgi:enoyl-[acyl-carrier-protein] reductase (NADH)
VTERIEDLTMQITRKMLSYALGRQLDYYDEATVRNLAKELEENDRRIPALIHAIVRSEAFQMKAKEKKQL